MAEHLSHFLELFLRCDRIAAIMDGAFGKPTHAIEARHPLDTLDLLEKGEKPEVIYQCNSQGNFAAFGHRLPFGW
jgi:hypothetical protein